MTRYVMVEELAKLMNQYAPPAWSKLAILGALHTGRVQLHAAKGKFRAFLPAYRFRGEDSPLPPRIRGEFNEADIIERYHLDLRERPNTEAIEVWTEEWDGEPWSIAMGWMFFSEPWDWVEPRIDYEQFEIPSDYEGLFGYDSLHPEGEPDLALNYDATFTGLCIDLADAEAIAPMIDLELVAFGSKTNPPVRKIGRPKRSGFESADEPLVLEMLAERRADPSLTARKLAEKYVSQAVGHGTTESKIKRLERRLWEYGV